MSVALSSVRFIDPGAANFSRRQCLAETGECVTLVDRRGTGRAETGSFSAAKKRGFWRLRACRGACGAWRLGSFSAGKSVVFGGCVCAVRLRRIAATHYLM
jgi:hypothetical protein